MRPPHGPTLVSALVVVSLLLAPAAAAGGVEVRRGSCSGPAHWELRAGKDGGRIEVTVEVDSDRVGQTWRWRIAHNGSRSASGSARTRGGGSFSVERRLVDLSGPDAISFRAAHRGHVCRGSLAI